MGKKGSVVNISKKGSAENASSGLPAGDSGNIMLNMALTNSKKNTDTTVGFVMNAGAMVSDGISRIFSLLESTGLQFHDIRTAPYEAVLINVVNRNLYNEFMVSTFRDGDDLLYTIRASFDPGRNGRNDSIGFSMTREDQSSGKMEHFAEGNTWVEEPGSGPSAGGPES